MLMDLLKTSLALFILAPTASYAGLSNRNSDPENDVHFNIAGFCQNAHTDILSTNFRRENSEYIVEMTMTQKISKAAGYKEYYFWLDLTHDKTRGFQPYLPYSVAWPDLYANYRIFYSVNAGVVPPFMQAKEKVRLQNCVESNCALDSALASSTQIKVSVTENIVTFRWPVGLLPELEKSKNIRIGYTTYYELMQCNGEDDSPQWGEEALRISFQKNAK